MSENQGENQAPKDPLADTTAPASGQPHRPGSPVPDQPGAGRVDPRNLRPKTGPIVWGVIVLAFCAYTASQAVTPGSVNGTTFVIAATISLGVILLIVGAAVIFRAQRLRAARDSVAIQTRDQRI